MSDRCQECHPDLIVRLVRAGDLAALDRISRCYGAHLLAVGRRVCRDDERARDAVQDALLAAGQRLDQFRGEGSVEGWLVRMVANACRSWRRGRKDDPAWNAPLDEEHEPACGGGADRPDDGAARSELAGALRAALLALSPIDRAVLLLTQVDGWRPVDVARQLDLSPESVRARLSRTRRRLRAELASAGAGWIEDVH
ncbi:MAG TPA: sigma-70 family RNA polymerase sigma factor [Kofleriaceae bacterium]|jgi:RNA polymerase sigma-70 factor (ECF subfamily)